MGNKCVLDAFGTLRTTSTSGHQLFRYVKVVVFVTDKCTFDLQLTTDSQYFRRVRCTRLQRCCGVETHENAVAMAFWPRNQFLQFFDKSSVPKCF